MELKLTSREMEGAHVLRLSGTLDSTTTKQLDAALAAAREARRTWIALDLSDVEYVSSAGWGTILAASEDWRKAGGALVVCCLQDHVQASFRMLDAQKVAVAVQGITEALQEFKQLRRGA